MPYESNGVIPKVGDMIEVVDAKATWSVNTVTMTRMGNQQFLDKYGNTDTTFILDVDGLYVQFIWDGTYWRIMQ